MKVAFIVFVAFLILFNTLQAGLQYIDRDFVNETTGASQVIYATISSHRFPLSLLLAFLASTLPIYKEYTGPKQIKNEMKQVIMETIITDIFNGDKQSIRVTIFRDVSWLRVIFRHFWDALHHPIVWYQTEGRKVPPYGKYLKVSKRVGTENPNSNTFFFFSQKTHKDCQGIVGLVRQKQIELIRNNLPDITQANLDVLDLETKTAEARSVKRYMEMGCINDLNTLKRLHIRARHFYGNILYNTKSEPVGVLVIDSTNDESPFNDEAVSKLSGFVKLFSSTF